MGMILLPRPAAATYFSTPRDLDARAGQRKWRSKRIQHSFEPRFLANLSLYGVFP